MRSRTPPNLVVVDDCVPDLDKTASAKKFVKAYEAEYGYPPNYASAQVYDTIHIAANAVEKVGHDPAKINKALAATMYDGVVRLQGRQEQRLANSVTMYEYKPDNSKKFLKTYQLEYVPSDELACGDHAAPGNHGGAVT